MGNELSSLNFTNFSETTHPISGKSYYKGWNDDTVSEKMKQMPQRKTYGPPLQKYSTPGDPKGVMGTWKYGHHTDQNHWVGSCWFFVWASCVNHRHPHDIDCQKARFMAEGFLTAPEAAYADNMYSKGCFDPVLGEWGFYGKLPVTERRAFTNLFNARKEEIAALEESEGSKFAAQEKMMSNDRAWKKSRHIKDQLKEQAFQASEYFGSFTDDKSKSLADRYLQQAKNLDTLRIQKAQLLMAGGVSEEQAIQAITPPAVPESTWLAGGSSLKTYIRSLQRSAWLKNDTVTRTRDELLKFASSGHDIATFPLTVEEQRAQIARNAAQSAAKGVDCAEVTSQEKRAIASLTAQQAAEITQAWTALFSTTSPRIIDWIADTSKNPVMMMADMLRTGSPNGQPRDLHATKAELYAAEMEALLGGPTIGKDATSRNRLDNFEAEKSRLERVAGAPELYFTEDGNYQSGTQPWEDPSRAWIETNEAKYDPDYESWMRKRARQVWNRFYGENFPTTLEAVKEICYNKDVRNAFFEKWDGMRLVLEDEREHKERYKGQPFKWYTLPTPGVDINAPGSYEFESRFGTAVTEGHPYLPGAYWSYKPVDWSEDILNPGVPFNSPPSSVVNLESWLGEE